MADFRVGRALYSENSESLNVRFINSCEKSIDIVWVPHEGLYHLYATLTPRQFVDVNTFTKHFWIFQERDTGLRLMANNEPYFKGVDHGYSLTARNHSKKRYVVFISRPLVMKLKTICINFICHNLRWCSDVKHLEIPTTLKRDIVKKIHTLNPKSHNTQV